VVESVPTAWAAPPSRSTRPSPRGRPAASAPLSVPTVPRHWCTRAPSAGPVDCV